MNNVKKILVPIDFSADSVRAAQHAVELCRLFGAELRLLHVIGIEFLAIQGDIPIWIRDLEDVKKIELNLCKERLKPFNIKTTSQVTLGIGSPWSTICDDAKKNSIDLIVLSTHGRTGAKRLLLGSVAENVVRHSTCPVFVLPAAHKKS